jgi:Ca2+/H+ antiporter
MAKVMYLLVLHLRRLPLSMTFHSDLRTAASRRPGTPSAQVLVCTYRAWGWEYYKYTIDGTNIFFVNLIFVVFFTIADEFFLAPLLHHRQYWIVHPGFIFTLALASIVPLAYFIGMAVASISAQSSMGMGAAINAFFGSVVEVFLYCVALTQGKSRLVEGSVVGSIFAGTLLMPGISMLFGALRRKTQRFNAKSAGVTSTMLLFSVIGAFAPTLFYQIYGTVYRFKIYVDYSLNCGVRCAKEHMEVRRIVNDAIGIKPMHLPIHSTYLLLNHSVIFALYSWSHHTLSVYGFRYVLMRHKSGKHLSTDQTTVCLNRPIILRP